MSYIQQIDELNTYVKTRIAPSGIHGVGLFALRDIPKGQRLYADIVPRMYNLPYTEFSDLFPYVKAILLERWPHIVNGSHFVYPDTKVQAYINHSSTPNYDGENDIALEDIKEGEEITEDYRKIQGWEQVHPWLLKSVI